MFSLVLLGPPGSGKGTQARRVCGETGAAYVGTGDLLREIAEGSSAEAAEVRERLASGFLFRDEEITALIAAPVAEAITCNRSLVFDGYPRRAGQGESLDSMLAGHSRPIIVKMDLSDDECKRRLRTRTLCADCRNPGRSASCEVCGGEMVRREDDVDGEAVERRLVEYHELTAPLEAYYADQGRLSVVDTRLPEKTVTDQILLALRPRGR